MSAAWDAVKIGETAARVAGRSRESRTGSQSASSRRTLALAISASATTAPRAARSLAHTSNP